MQRPVKEGNTRARSKQFYNRRIKLAASTYLSSQSPLLPPAAGARMYRRKTSRPLSNNISGVAVVAGDGLCGNRETPVSVKVPGVEKNFDFEDIRGI
jgi:hypothetical protein